MMAKKHANKILIIGWDAADWDVIDPLIQQGRMPALQRLISGGVYGRLKTMDPPLSPMLWTSIATGVRADKHGICGFVEPSADGEGLKPVSSSSRKVKALWNIYTQQGLKSNVVAWWPTNPVEKINGVMVSNLYQVAQGPLDKEWGMPEGTIHPEEFQNELKKYRVHPGEITPYMVLPFVPNIKDNIELRKDNRVASVSKILANAASVHAASTYLMEKTEWDLMAVYHDAIDHFSHIAMKYHPPRRKHIDEVEYENFKEIVEAGYMFHDMMLERTLELIDDQTTVILLSDHGFYPDHRRPITLPKEPSGPAAEHSPYGIIVMNGPGIKTGGERITGASVIDITPTVLALAGMPVGSDMEGKVLIQSFADPVQPDFIESWEKVEGECGMHDPSEVEDPWAAQEALQQLVELGYIEEMDDDKLQMVERSKAESEYYKARNMIDGGRVKEAVPVLDRIFNETGIIRYGQRLAFAYLQLKSYDKVAEVIEKLRLQEKSDLEKAKEIKRAEKPDDPFLNIEFEEPKYLDYIEGLMFLALNRPLKALKLLEGVLKKNPNSLEVPLNIAKIHLLRKDFKRAEKMYIHALAVDPLHAQAHHGLGLAMLRLKRPDDAVEEFLSALESNFYLPNVHYHLGEALYKMEDFEHAAEAFEMAVRLSPGMTKARKWLKLIYEVHLKLPNKAKEHEDFLQEHIKGEVIVITGLPRTGASVVAQMLTKGGCSVVIEEEKPVNRKEGLRNEFKRIAELSAGSVISNEGQRRAVVVPANLLNQLPQDFNYKIIRMERDLGDVLVSQQKVLGRKLNHDTIPVRMFNTIQKQNGHIDTWINSLPQSDVLILDFEELMHEPLEQAMVVADFVGGDLDPGKMAEVVRN
jgi:predicted AlkP superfamily phosphohydrolase/phosphomutase/tetratricopeptide (TPR) repeat protein